MQIQFTMPVPATAANWLAPTFTVWMTNTCSTPANHDWFGNKQRNVIIEFQIKP